MKSILFGGLLGFCLWGTFPARAQIVPQVTAISLPATALAYDETHKKFYATVGKGVPLEQANSLVTIDPRTGKVEKSVYMGSSEPHRVSVSLRGKYVFVGLGELWRRYDTATQSAGPYVTWDGGGFLKQIYPHPTDPEASLVLLGGRHGYLGSEAAILRDGKLLPTTASQAGDALLTTVSPTTFYIGDRAAVKIVPDGVQMCWATEQDVPFGEICEAGLSINSSGFVYDMETREEIGHLANNAPDMKLVADPQRGSILRLQENKITVYDLRTLKPIREIPIPGYRGGRNLIRWGDDGLAFLTDKEIVFVKADLGPRLSAVDLVLTRSPLQGATEPGNTCSYRLTIKNKSKADCPEAYLTDKLPGGIEVANVTASQGVARAVGSLLRASLGRIRAGRSVTIDVQFLITAASPMKFYSVVRAYEPDSDGENNISMLLPPE